MIAKRIAKKPDVKDSFAALAYYIAAAGDDGEKLDRLWIAGCDAGGDAADLDAAVAEVESTRRLGPAADNKTYHLIVSFRPGDREKLSAADLAAVEAAFAEALGFAGHQRVVGTHVNTDNVHLHAAYNKVHPETLKVHTPYKDFFTLSTVCRQLEKKYGLTVDRGMEARGDKALGPGARDYEAETWRESFQTHLLGHKQEIVRRALAAATRVPDGVKFQKTATTKAPDGVKFRKTAATGRVPPRSASRQRPAIPTGRVRWSAATRRSRGYGSATAARGGPASRGGGRSDARSATGSCS